MAHVLLDCDGPLANFALAYFREAIRVVAKTRPPDAPFARSVADIREWDLARGLGLTDEERDLVVAEIHRPGWVASLARMSGAAPGVRALREAGHEIHFVTSPWPGHATWMHERVEWLARHFDARHDEITFTHRKDGAAVLRAAVRSVAAGSQAGCGKLAECGKLPPYFTSPMNLRSPAREVGSPCPRGCLSTNPQIVPVADPIVDFGILGMWRTRCAAHGVSPSTRSRICGRRTGTS